MLSVNEEFPSFALTSVQPNGNEMTKITNDDFLGDWAVIYFYPKDFTFICPTEIAAMDKLLPEAKVLGISGDNEFCKAAWKEANGMIREIQHPLAADCGLKLSHTLGIVDWVELVALRATFIIDPDGIIQSANVNALDTGRNVDEILRTVQALKAGGLTGCDWTPGEEFVA
jgi:peroxiredoxin (alkyl hydroperoxide reductase subunit C)